MLNMFRTLRYPSWGACDCVVKLPHRSSCSVKTDVLAISVPLRCVVVCVWCDVFCRLVVIGRCILINFYRYILCFYDHCVRLCVVFFIGCLVFSAFICTYFIHVVQYRVPCRRSPLCECWCERALESCTNMNNLISCLCSNYKVSRGVVKPKEVCFFILAY